MSPWKVILATMVIFVCGLVTGILIVKTTDQNSHIAPPVVDALPAVAPTAPASNSLPQIGAATNFVTKTNVVFAPFQQERMALIRQMVNKLHLDPDQKERISQIIKDSQERNRQLWQQIAPQMHAELKRVTDDIRAQLRPGQAHRFTELLRENRKPNRPAGAETNNPAPPIESTNPPATTPA